jgi:chaperonin GroES
MAFRPLHDRVLVKRVSAATKSAGGLYIPDTASKDKPQEGSVIAVGPGRRTDDGKLREPSVKAGDRVLFGKYTGDEIKLEGEEHVILRESDILAVIED